MTQRRTDVSSWEETFMGIAHCISRRSKDPSTQVGACIVSEDNRILSLGYNGATRGFDDDVFPWGKDSSNPLETKYPYVVHAEHNAILNYRGSNKDFQGATVYVTHYPCNECAKSIIQVGIKKVVYERSPSRLIAGNMMYEATDRMFMHAGVEVTSFVM